MLGTKTLTDMDTVISALELRVAELNERMIVALRRGEDAVAMEDESEKERIVLDGMKALRRKYLQASSEPRIASLGTVHLPLRSIRVTSPSAKTI